MYRRKYYKKRYREEEDPFAELISLIVIGVFGYLTYLYFTNRTKFWYVSIITISVTTGVTTLLIILVKKRQEIAENKKGDLTVPTLNGVRDEQTETTNQRYDLKPSLLTPTEEKFLNVLKQVVGNRYQIIPQMQLSRIINMRGSYGRYKNYRDLGRINNRSVDFVLCDEKLKPCIAIELDDYTHEMPKRIKRDTDVNQIMQDVGLKLIRIPVSENYDTVKLEASIFSSSNKSF